MCKVCSHPARSRAAESSATALAVAIDRALAPAAPAAPAIKLMDVVRVAGEKRRAVVIDIMAFPQRLTTYYVVMFRDGHRAQCRAADLTYVAPALGK